MLKPTLPFIPSDQDQRTAALDTARSFIVEAPAGSGKTDLLTRRFLRLLTEVDDPAQIVAITFTRPAAAEMRHRILSELEKAASAGIASSDASTDPISMSTLARKALIHAQNRDWHLRDLPGQLRIATIDSFCREIAIQQPLISGVGSALEIHENPNDLYRRAARRTLEKIQSDDARLRSTIETLLLWRDNNWAEMEDLLVKMLAKRDSWMHNFVLQGYMENDALRWQLEQPFRRAIRTHLQRVHALLNRVAGAPQELLALARFAYEQSGGTLHEALAQAVDIPADSLEDPASVEQALSVWRAIASLLLTDKGSFRKVFDKRLGFPADARAEKERVQAIVRTLSTIDGLEDALAAVAALPPAAYTEDDWKIVRACFTLLTHAASELRVVFAEAGATDFIEVAQIAQSVLRQEDGYPSEAAFVIADGIRHILVDEFQDTSRRQHHLLASLIAAWPDSVNRSLFVVGDPKQSIYFFRDADAELFPRVAKLGLETSEDSSFVLHGISLSDNFRTTPPLVESLNQVFSRVFALPDGSGIAFSDATPARRQESSSGPGVQLHLAFIPRSSGSSDKQNNASPESSEKTSEAERAQEEQLQQIVQLIHAHRERIEQARVAGKKYRIAILGRTRAILARVASALRQAGIPFYAVELEKLKSQPEILDALSLGRALLNPYDRVAWLGVLRAPWCGMGLDDLFKIAGTDDLRPPLPDVPSLLRERMAMLSEHGQSAARRVIRLLDALPRLSAGLPNATLGTWLKQAWLLIDGHRCVDAAAWANLDLLWRCLDRVPGGAQGFLGGELDDVLEGLTALPNPAAHADWGVQLMTIHKSKGLEFEVVIVPDLQAGASRGDRTLLSWLERGLMEHEATGAISEFLVAPIQTKGSKGGQTKEWVDREIQRREDQEMRRILYVASTRAREELHLFARPTCTQKDGELRLAPPARSLLTTAWPGVQQEIERQFELWTKVSVGKVESPQEGLVESLAASGSERLPFPPRPEAPAILRRLPALQEAPTSHPVSALAIPPAVENIQPEAFARHQGGWYARALGNAVHSLFDMLAPQSAATPWEDARSQLRLAKPRIVSQLRAFGADQSQAAAIAEEALKIVLEATLQEECKWILSPHPHAGNEAAWTGIVDGTLRNVRVDRLFLAGDIPLSSGQSTLWIIDYKTAHTAVPDAVGQLPQLRAIFAPQLELYGTILRHAFPEISIHAGLYYPRMRCFDWWKVV